MKEKPLTHALASSATCNHDHMSCHSNKHKVNEHEGHMYNQEFGGRLASGLTQASMYWECANFYDLRHEALRSMELSR